MPSATTADLPEDLRRIAHRVWRCTRCRLHGTRTHAVPGSGPPRARIAFVGEAPGRAEDRTGRPFMGAAGAVFDEALKRARVPRDRSFVTNVVKCRPPGNRRPRADEVASCQPYLLAQLATLRPAAVVALGQTATRALLGPDAELARVRGRWREWEGTPVLATYHPAAVLYNRRLMTPLVADLRRVRSRTEAR